MHPTARWDPGLVGPAEPAAATAVVRSYESFYAETRDRVGRALALTLHDPELAADAVDEAMVRAYVHWDRVALLDNPAGWVYRVGLNFARSRLRRRRGREQLLHDPAHHDPPSVQPEIADAVRRLPTRLRSVVVCRFVLGWSEGETARSLNLRAGTVKSRLHRALQRLQLDLDHLRED